MTLITFDLDLHWFALLEKFELKNGNFRSLIEFLFTYFLDNIIIFSIQNLNTQLLVPVECNFKIKIQNTNPVKSGRNMIQAYPYRESKRIIWVIINM